MKTVHRAIWTLLIFAGFIMADNRMTEFKAGYLGPEDAKGGFFGGINLGRMVDENVGISFGMDFYHSSYTKDTKIRVEDQGQGDITVVAREVDQSMTAIPLFFNLNYVGPVSPALDLKVTGGVGYELLWNSVTKYEENIDKTKFFSGFAWHISAGVSMPISRASDFFGELVYHHSTPSRDQGETELGLPVRSEIRMSGLGFRVGLRIYNFGF